MWPKYGLAEVYKKLKEKQKIFISSPLVWTNQDPSLLSVIAFTQIDQQMSPEHTWLKGISENFIY